MPLTDITFDVDELDPGQNGQSAKAQTNPLLAQNSPAGSGVMLVCETGYSALSGTIFGNSPDDLGAAVIAYYNANPTAATFYPCSYTGVSGSNLVFDGTAAPTSYWGCSGANPVNVPFTGPDAGYKPVSGGGLGLLWANDVDALGALVVGWYAANPQVGSYYPCSYTGHDATFMYFTGRTNINPTCDAGHGVSVAYTAANGYGTAITGTGATTQAQLAQQVIDYYAANPPAVNYYPCEYDSYDSSNLYFRRTADPASQYGCDATLISLPYVSGTNC